MRASLHEQGLHEQRPRHETVETLKSRYGLNDMILEGKKEGHGVMDKSSIRSVELWFEWAGFCVGNMASLAVQKRSLLPLFHVRRP
jgi:hypothetical protein